MDKINEDRFQLEIFGGTLEFECIQHYECELKNRSEYRKGSNISWRTQLALAAPNFVNVNFFREGAIRHPKHYISILYIVTRARENTRKCQVIRGRSTRAGFLTAATVAITSYDLTTTS